jgi:hypothetical protein
MNQLDARFGLFLDTLIIIIPVMIIGYISEKIYKKITNKDVPDNYYTYVVGGGFVIYIVLKNLLKQ